MIEVRQFYKKMTYTGYYKTEPPVFELRLGLPDNWKQLLYKAAKTKISLFAKSVSCEPFFI